MAQPNLLTILVDARTALKDYRKDDVVQLLREYRHARRMQPAPMIALNPPHFYAKSFREPISGDKIAKALRDALTHTDHLVIIDWMVE